jgi:hypothetical protein
LSKQYHIRWRKCQKYFYVTHWQKNYWHFGLLYLYTFSLFENPSLIIVSAETKYNSTRSWYFRNACTKSGSLRFSVFRLLTDFVCLYNYEFRFSFCKIARSSVILLFTSHIDNKIFLTFFLTSLSLYIFTIWKSIAYNRFCRDEI